MLQQPQYNTINQYGTPTIIQMQSIQHYDVSTYDGHWNIIQWLHDGRWLFQKNRWWIMIVVRKPFHPCGSVARTTTSFAIYTAVTSR
jgi:hypothetical protein